MYDQPYVTVQAAREEAGLQRKYLDTRVTGTVNASNKAFVASVRPIVDSNDDGAVNKQDVVAYVNGSPVAIDTVVSATGVVTLVAAPANGTVITLEYYTSAANDSYVEGIIDDATSWAANKVKRVVTLPYDEDEVPGIVKAATRLFAGGLMLIRDYGSSADTDLSSKDGYKKLQLAKELLDGYITGEEDTGDEPSQEGAAIGTKTDGEIYTRLDDLGSAYGDLPDDQFMRRENSP